MSDLRALYQELIIDHGRHPRNFKKLPQASCVKEGFNPLCGDRLTLYLQLENDVVLDVAFEGAGCAISMSSASLMTQALKGKTVQEAHALFDAFHQIILGSEDRAVLDQLGKLAVLKGVSEFPSRVKCATLAWHTAMAAIDHQDGNISTE